MEDASLDYTLFNWKYNTQVWLREYESYHYTSMAKEAGELSIHNQKAGKYYLNVKGCSKLLGGLKIDKYLL